MLTLQEIFNKCAEHLLTQRKRSIHHGTDKCMYRGQNGLKCAAGIFINDECYKPELEQQNVQSEDVLRALLNSDFPVHETCCLELLDRLQELHDRRVPAQWKTRLSLLAISFKLDSSILEKFP